MDPMNEAELEARLHALLCDDLDEPRRRDVLSRVARDEKARKLLADLISLQERSRAAFGYDRAEPAMAAGLARLKDAMKQNDGPQGNMGATAAALGSRGMVQGTAANSAAVAPSESPSSNDVPARKVVGPASRRGSVRRVFRMRMGMRLMAAAVVVACLCLAAVTRWDNQVIRKHLDDLSRQLTRIDQRPSAVIQVSADDLKRYSTIWRETKAAGDSGQPWILIRDGVGRFEYLPAAPATATSSSAGQMVLLRCSVVSPEGAVLEEFNLLLPQDRTVQLSMDESQSLGGRPLRCRVASEDRWVGMGLEVGTGAAECVGVQGRVAVGGSPSEIGQFRLDHRNVKVFLQAMPLAGTVG